MTTKQVPTIKQVPLEQVDYSKLNNTWIQVNSNGTAFIYYVPETGDYKVVSHLKWLEVEFLANTIYQAVEIGEAIETLSRFSNYKD